MATTPSGTDGIQLYGGDVLGERGRTSVWREGEGWDQGQLAPLVVTTDDGRQASVRSASWTG